MEWLHDPDPEVRKRGSINYALNSLVEHGYLVKVEGDYFMPPDVKGRRIMNMKGRA